MSPGAETEERLAVRPQLPHGAGSGEDGQLALAGELPQQRPAPGIGRENAGIGRQPPGHLRPDAQGGAEAHPPQAGQGIALALGRGQDPLQARLLLHGAIEAPSQAAFRVRELTVIRLLQHPQAGEQGELRQARVPQLPSQLPLPGIDLLRRPGDFPRDALPRPQHAAQLGGGAGAFAVPFPVMGGALAQDGQRRKGQTQLPDGFQILHGQDVVGLAQQQGAVAQPLLRRPLPRCGKGETGLPLQQRLDRKEKARLPQGVCQRLQRIQLPGLAAEAQVRTPQGAQQAHRAPGKALRGAETPGERQLHRQIRPAAAGGLGPGKLVVHRGLAPLDEVPGLYANHRALLPQGGAALLNMQFVPPVEGVILADDPNDGHRLLPRKKTCNILCLY